ncbi:MAG: triphosphoribosyl-dephospho-CoA synthase [Hyphomicrobiaceae bacterium]
MSASSPPPATEAIAAAFLEACRDELSALKPGNVHIHAAGHDMDWQLFEAAAKAAEPFVAAPGLGVGERIRSAVAASMTTAGCNTNLGILLLCVPLAEAGLRLAASRTSADAVRLRAALRGALDDLNQADAVAVYEAIRLANPGGLGRDEEADVADAPSLGLVAAMRIAAGRDRIARAYTDGFADVFADHLPVWREFAREAGQGGRHLAVTSLHMSILARFPDSHIVRKHGAMVAERVRDMAAHTLAAGRPLVEATDMAKLFELDHALKSERLNPGTTADFVVATLFADRLAAGRL